MTTAELPHACPELKQFLEDPRVPVEYNARFREYSLALVESVARQSIRYCPWCGAELPSSVRELFFTEMERLGIDYPSESPPAPFVDDTWWRAIPHSLG
jgi:hypothetical protein